MTLEEGVGLTVHPCPADPWRRSSTLLPSGWQTSTRTSTLWFTPWVSSTADSTILNKKIVLLASRVLAIEDWSRFCLRHLQVTCRILALAWTSSWFRSCQVPWPRFCARQTEKCDVNSKQAQMTKTCVAPFSCVSHVRSVVQAFPLGPPTKFHFSERL